MFLVFSLLFTAVLGGRHYCEGGMYYNAGAKAWDIYSGTKVENISGGWLDGCRRCAFNIRGKAEDAKLSYKKCFKCVHSIWGVYLEPSGDNSEAICNRPGYVKGSSYSDWGRRSVYATRSLDFGSRYLVETDRSSLPAPARIVPELARSIYVGCDAPQGEVVSVAVNGPYPCRSHPCRLMKQQQATIEIKFKVKARTTGAKAVVTGLINGTPTPFPYDGLENACSGKFGLACPLVPGVTYTYKASFPVEFYYPSIKLIAIYELRDQNDRKIACLKIPVYILD